MTPCLDADTFGLYRVKVMPKVHEPEACVCPADEQLSHDELVQEIRRSAARLRNLGEDLDEVVVLKPQPVSLTTTININHQRHPDEILAEIIFRLGLYLAPEPRRQSLDDCIKSGKTPAEIYEGPPMQRGFIDDAQLAVDLPMLTYSDLKEVMAAVFGVLEVEALVVILDPQIEEKPEKGELALSSLEQDDQGVSAVNFLIKEGAYPHLQIDLNRPSSSFHLCRDGRPVVNNPERVKRLLNRHWQNHRQTFNLDQGYLQSFPLPAVNGVEDGDYASIQILFPSAYGLMRSKGDPSLSPLRQAQMNQLKGYLMVFDQLMADSAAQLSFLRDLFSPLAGGEQTYAYRSLRTVSGIDPDLLISNYDLKQASLNQRLDDKDRRQARILDFLLAIYGQRLLPSTASDSYSSTGEAVSQQILQAKQELLRDVIVLSRERGCGLNYFDADHLSGPTALERRCAMELRLRCAQSDPVMANIEQDAAKATFGRLLSAEASRRVRESFLGLAGLMATSLRPLDRDSEFDPFAGKTVAADLWPALANPSRYRIGGCDVGDDVDLVCIDDTGRCWWLASFAHARFAHAYAQQLQSKLGATAHSLFIVEWVLLRHALRPPASCSIAKETFQARISVVVMREKRDPDEAHTLAHLLRPHVPAHLELQVHVFGPRRFARFVERREVWLKSLAGADPESQAIAASRVLSSLLDGQLPPPGDTSSAPVVSRPPAEPDLQPTPPAEREPVPTPLVEPVPTDASLQAVVSPLPLAEPIPAAPASRAITSDLSMKMMAAPAPVSAAGVFCDSALDIDLLPFWRTAGLRFLMRHLPWQPNLPGALTAEELSTLLLEEWALMPFQDPSAIADPPALDPALAPDAAAEELGRRHGEAAVQAAQALQIPTGVVIWLAGQPGAVAAHPSALIAYINRWSQAIDEAGYASGVLLTVTIPLINVRCEWLARWDAAVPTPMLGFGLERDRVSDQQPVLAGQGGILRVQQDRRGRTPQWLALDPRALRPTPP
ncbi:MAG: glycoside hydrolase domain-containing protein [Cyanobacteriota bacterium]|nr:glycoside hydrolase domain-containing protein [Cyanobacteriota bacterium]